MSALTETADSTFKTVFETEDGGQIRFYVAHGRFYVTKQGRDGRHRITTAAPVERMRLLATRLNELCAVAETAETETV